MGTAVGSHLSSEKAEGEGDRRALSGMQRGECRPLSPTEHPLLQRMEPSSVLPGGPRGQREEPPDVSQALE